jgi:SAM-dependent methyltransferase
MQLTWHAYRYYPYERVLAAREAATLLNGAVLRETASGFALRDSADIDRARRLTYFSGVQNGRSFTATIQAQLEGAVRNGKNRQATRYSVHGLHEYKGKFNPQVAKAILNIFDIRGGSRILDPFCGSGTTLVECAHLGAVGFGADINPLAVFVANAKLQALSTPAAVWRELLTKIASRCGRLKRWQARLSGDSRDLYLQSWFQLSILHVIEIMQANICDIAGEHAAPFLAVASNLLRDYSQQDPNDLRIRRRLSPLPETPFPNAFLAACEQFISRLEDVQHVLGTDFPLGEAVLAHVESLGTSVTPGPFDGAITSPPYAMALPYIDTQRLSLVWLGLLPAERILALEAELIGSRELRGAKREVHAQLAGNTAFLPPEEAEYCLKLQKALGPSDGFRRQAVPALLYRYFAAMRDSFTAIRRVLKPEAPFALIVGHNHTVLSGVRFDINTPMHLANLAGAVGWTVTELIDLQTYHRYGYHMSNAVAAETLVLLKNA